MAFVPELAASAAPHSHNVERSPTAGGLAPRVPGIRALHSPGPTRLPEAVLAAMQRPMMDLADPRVAATIAACEQGMAKLLDAQPGTHLVFYSANGHGMWEATTANLSAPGKALLIAGGGHFSDSWAAQTEVLGKLTGTAVLRTPHREGTPIDCAAIERVLREDREQRISAVLAVHTDTASGITSDLQGIRRAIDAAGHPALFVVDAVASAAAAPLSMASMGIDVVMGASQKGLMGPPGLGFAAVNTRAMQFTEQHAAARFYWDWARRASDKQYLKFCGTPPLAHLAALEAALGLIEQEGLAKVHARHRRLGSAVNAALVQWAKAGSVQAFCKDPAAQSASVTAIEVLPHTGIEPEALRAIAREQFQVAIAGGLGPLFGRVFRIGHLGDMNEAMILGALAGVEAAMLSVGLPFGQGGLAAAIQALAKPAQPFAAL